MQRIIDFTGRTHWQVVNEWLECIHWTQRMNSGKRTKGNMKLSLFFHCNWIWASGVTRIQKKKTGCTLNCSPCFPVTLWHYIIIDCIGILHTRSDNTLRTIFISQFVFFFGCVQFSLAKCVMIDHGQKIASHFHRWHNIDRIFCTLILK